MLTRLLAVAIATAALLLTGCQTLTKEGYLPPDKRDNRDNDPYKCRNDPECYVQVDPNKPQWVPEYIQVFRGKKLDLWLPSGWEFEDPPVTMKPTVPAVLDCSEKNKQIVKCKLREDASTEIKYGYTIHVKGKPEYDPFVWPQ